MYKKIIYPILSLVTLVLSIGFWYTQFITLDDNLFQGFNAGITGNFNPVLFQYGGNMSVGWFYWNTPKTVSAQTIQVGLQSIAGCTQQLRWLYFNTQRWARVWPLDNESLIQLQAIDSSYNNLTINGGLYTNCNGTTSGEVYGYIEHNWNNTHYHMIAWVTLNFATNTYVGIFDDTLLFSNFSGAGYIYDPLGWIGSLTNLYACGDGNITTGEQCDDNNTTPGDGCSNMCAIEPGYSCIGMPSVCTLINNSITGFNGWFQFPSLYTNSLVVDAYISVSEPAGYIFAGDLQWTFGGTTALTWTSTLLLSPGEGTKTITASFTSLASGYIDQHVSVIILDQTIPTITITQPTSWYQYLGDTTAFVWTASDSSGISGYLAQVLNNSWNIIASLQTQSTWRTLQSLANGNYSLSVKATDMAGNFTGKIHPFSVSGSTHGMSWFSLPVLDEAEDVDIDTLVTSQPIPVSGLPYNTTVLASVSEGVLIINGEAVGTTGLVQNGDIIEIEIISSDDYDDSITVTLTVNNLTTEFVVTTAEEDEDTEDFNYCTSKDKITLILLLRTIIGVYDGNTPRLINILELLITMIEDKVDELLDDDEDEKAERLQCFAEIADDYLISLRTDDNNNSGSGWFYTAPNGKVYAISFDPGRKVYSSPDFKQPKYYISYETLTKHIDKQNPKRAVWDHTSLDTSFTPINYTAPNGKVFRIQKTNKWYMSFNFINPKYFWTLDDIKTHINKNNPKK